MFNIFKKEVLDRGPEACLPCNLSDKWLLVLAEQAEELLDGQNDDVSFTELLSLIITILSAKKDDIGTISINLTDFFDCFAKYRVELALEEMSRNTDLKYEPATLVNILENRDVNLLSEIRP